ncbi:MAG: helix-turn-helix transcriptional regulator [Mucilaginibacter sp.]|nr:helix-turn-helix transcriptional regulator [Mucilaginibacter sp.]
MQEKNTFKKVSNIVRGIKETRENLNYTQEYLATCLGISQHAYSKIESGFTRLTVEHLIDISEALNVTSEILIARGEMHG